MLTYFYMIQSWYGMVCVMEAHPVSYLVSEQQGSPVKASAFCSTDATSFIHFHSKYEIKCEMLHSIYMCLIADGP